MKHIKPLFLTSRLLAACCLLPAAVCFSQPLPDTSKTSDKVLFEAAEEYFFLENYEKALSLYKILLGRNQNNSNWNFHIGLCYLNSPTEYNRAINHFERAASNVSERSKDNSYQEEKAPLVTYLYLGNAYHRNYRFEEAIVTYKKFQTYLAGKNPYYSSLVEHKIKTCKNAMELVANPVNMIIHNLGPEVNSPYPDYSPVISVDESILLFTSRRPENIGGKVDDNGKYFEDIYLSYLSENEKGWLPAKNVGAPINTSGHEATIGTSVDGQILFIYKDDADSGSVYMTSMQGENWSVPEKMVGDMNSKHWESHATLSADGNTLYFTSSRPGGFGGKDIYRCKKLPNGQWSKAMNLGPVINTPFEEDSPFLQPGSNTLYFSSQGHKCMGGFDIFYSNFTDTGITGGWTVPENIGYPVNTTGDDIFFVPTVDNKRAYYSSFAEGSFGDKDIYMLTFPEKEESKLTVLTGLVSDRNGKLPPGVVISVEDANSGDFVGQYLPNSRTRKYLFILSRDQSYKITYEADGYHTVSNTYKLEAGKEYLSTGMVFTLKEVIMEKKELGTVGVFGTVTDIQKKIIQNANITVTDNSTKKVIGNFSSDHQGRFSFILERGKNYNVSFEAEGYLFQSENVNLPKELVYSSIERNVVLQPIVSGSKNILKNIFFDFNKATLRSESFVELDRMYALLSERSNIKVEISGHTDNKGDDKLNLKLSDKRAKAVMEYLVKKGIKKDRLSAKGYGKGQPITTNDTDEGRQLNRRVEMKIVEK